MHVVVTLEHRFDRTPDGAVWTQTQCPYTFWQRYLEVFDGVRVVARVRDLPAVSDAWTRADGPGVSFLAVPYDLGPWQYLRRRRAVGRVVRDAVGPDDAVLLRVPGRVGTLLATRLHRSARPYGVEVVSDPYDVFAPGSVRHPLRPLFRWLFPRQLRRVCRHASTAAYVTQQALQRRYPCPSEAIGVSDVDLPADAFVPAPRRTRPAEGALTLITVATLAQLYKAPDVLIDAVAACALAGLDLRLVLVGDGKHRPELEARAAAHGLAGRVSFRGQLTVGGPVRAQLDAADLFVLPSYQEGLPRAMVEAMARALPCLGSTVGGIPELLPEEDLVPPGRADALAAKIREVAADPPRLARMSARNLAKAAEYRADILHERRRAFYRCVREQTEAWLTGRVRTPPLIPAAAPGGRV
jgi:glycosyltransferase involved in cell wall biosynthesis